MEQVKQMGYTVLRVFFGTLISAFIANATQLWSLSWSDWQPYVMSAIASALVVVLNYVNPKDERYGLGATDV